MTGPISVVVLTEPRADKMKACLLLCVVLVFISIDARSITSSDTMRTIERGFDINGLNSTDTSLFGLISNDFHSSLRRVKRQGAIYVPVFCQVGHCLLKIGHKVDICIACKKQSECPKVCKVSHN